VRSGFAFARRSGRRLWQDGYYDHVLRDDESTIAVARYIFENPVRAGLARRVEEYPHSGSEVFSMAEILTAWDHRAEALCHRDPTHSGRCATVTPPTADAVPP